MTEKKHLAEKREVEGCGRFGRRCWFLLRAQPLDLTLEFTRFRFPLFQARGEAESFRTKFGDFVCWSGFYRRMLLRLSQFVL